MDNIYENANKRKWRQMFVHVIYTIEKIFLIHFRLKLRAVLLALPIAAVNTDLSMLSWFVSI